MALKGQIKASSFFFRGPSLYYVSIFLDSFWPTYVSINTELNVSKNCHFPTPPTQTFYWRNIGMVSSPDSLLCTFWHTTMTTYYVVLKSSRNKKDLNDVTAARFSVSFSQLPAAKKHPKLGSCDVIKVLLISWRLYQVFWIFQTLVRY